MVRVYITGCSDVTLRWLRRLFSGELIPVQLSIYLFTVVFSVCCKQWRNYVRSALRQTFPRRPNIPLGPQGMSKL